MHVLPQLCEQLATHDVHGWAQCKFTMQGHTAYQHLIDLPDPLEVKCIRICTDGYAALQGGQMPSQVWDRKGRDHCGWAIC